MVLGKKGTWPKVDTRIHSTAKKLTQTYLPAHVKNTLFRYEQFVYLFIVPPGLDNSKNN